MIKDPNVFLNHILESTNDIETYTNGLDNHSFREYIHKDKQDAVIRRLEIIGEAIRNLPDEYKSKNSSVEWSKPLAMRNKLIHEYFGVDLDLVWYTATIIIPLFKNQIEKLLAESEDH